MRDDYEFNVQFCNLIENHPVLYDYNRPEYSNRNVQEQAWESIAGTCDDDVKECKRRWSNIRNRYAKYKKLISQPSGSAAKTVKQYYLGPHLKFLDTYLKSRSLKSKRRRANKSIDAEDDSDADDRGSPLSVSPPPQIESIFNDPSPLSPGSSKKSTPTHKDVSQSGFNYFITKQLSSQARQPELDTDLAFLQSMLPDMKAMNSAQKRRFKMGVMQLATQILDESETTYSSCNTQYNSPLFSNFSDTACDAKYLPPSDGSPARTKRRSSSGTPAISQ
ncbi:hypothetical protein evm_001667 [Chilo suppressalis]|nr:hypothetical protein evm_001667 [Chilo suppressalis]